MTKHYGEFPERQRQFLRNFEQEAKLAEAHQVNDLISSCTNKFQFAKTYKVYIKDWEKTRKTMLTQEEVEGRPKKEMIVEMVAIGDELLKDKLEKLQQHFLATWGEPITNYTGNLTPEKDASYRATTQSEGGLSVPARFFIVIGAMLLVGLLLQALG